MSSNRRRGATKGKRQGFRRDEPYFENGRGRLVLASLDVDERGVYFTPRRHRGTRKGQG